jgi:hypothetical protein
MASITERIALDIETALDDSSVLVLTGKRREKQNAQARRIVITRASGTLSPSTAPDGKNAATKARIKFRRTEIFRIVLHAETEETLDQLFDNFVVSVWEKFAPNAFEDESPYTWEKEDADHGGASLSRAPSITLLLTFRLMIEGKAKLSTIINSAPVPGASTGEL